MKISIIIPVLNEENGIDDVLSGISSQTYQPDEVVFVDAGSTDLTVNRITGWGKENPYLCLRVIVVPGAFPGKGRNVGVKNSRNDIIVFLDAGIKPSPGWLKALVETKKINDVAVWASCRILGNNPVSRLLASYSFGHGAVIAYALPGALFEKKVFETIGYLREDLRAAEDLVWREQFIERYGVCPVSNNAIIEYSTFPQSIDAAYKKWFVYAYYTAVAGKNVRQQIAYSCFFLSLIFSLFFSVSVFSILLVSYFILRGILDPIRRSVTRPWFQGYKGLFILGPLFVICLDLSKWLGFIKGSISRRLSVKTR